METEKELTYDETMFVWEFLKDRNRTQAAIRVGKPPSWAPVWGSVTYRKPNVKAAIDKAMGLIYEELKIDAKWVLNEYIKLYNVDLSEITTYDNRGEPIYDFTNASPELMHAISAIDIAPGMHGTKVKVTLSDKKSLLDQIGKHMDVNAFKDIIEHQGNITVIMDKQDEENLQDDDR